MRENQKNYLERQKVRNLRSSLRKQPTFRNATTGFLRLVAGVGRGGTGYLRSNISPFHYLSWKVKGRKNRFRSRDPFRGLFGGHLRFVGSIARICKKSVMPLPIMGQQQRISHCPFDMYDTIIHCKIYRGGMVWCVPSHKSFRLCC